MLSPDSPSAATLGREQERCGAFRALVGLGVGLILSALLSRAITLMLFGVNPLDPLTYALTTIALCVAAATASCVPAIRATRAFNVAALKAE